MLWFYRDNEDKRQGPFWPGQMRQWLEAGYLPKNMLIAPSFKGEVPRDYVPLSQLFPSFENAFLARSDIPAFPIAVSQPKESSDNEDVKAKTRHESTKKRPKWLEESIERQRLGIKRQKLPDTAVSSKDLYN
uniref:GYF domain-containing protein n=1 Tax=Aureoumbra lagunensis TaxID=44058 RepID=A0A7S3K6W3_9STRA|mmetsp:Transcript_5956/g.8785  ORF Transcript_5956/g.8785 Transcript_5956/m.8785 type:complete len:132 (+) Transcript_5956:206-601(+)